ncbi:MAG: hypothetical protein F6K23_09140 [Okeania sp. SIO2C9]|nr:hypothetical protein [Okeania sp. SIO2C9]
MVDKRNPTLTKSEVRSQKRCDPATTSVARERAPRESEVNPPLAPPPPRRGSRGLEQRSKNIAP